MKLETQKIEYKISWRDEYLKWICGFANSGGGKLYIGIDDNGKVIGVHNVKRLLEDIPNKIADTMSILPQVNLIKKDKKDVDLLFQDEVYGPLIKQVDVTMDLIFTKYLKGLIYYKGIQRIDQYPIDMDGFREILINAIIHKDYSIKNPIQISVYKDKVYVFNEGQFPEKLNTEEVLYKKHSSKPYNPTIANVFYKAGFIEGWGRGFEKIMEGVKRNPGIRPEYKIDESGVMVCYRACKKYKELLKSNSNQNVPVNVPVNVSANVPVNILEKLTKTQRNVYEAIKNNRQITREGIANDLNLSIKTIARAISDLKNNNLIERCGSDKNGYRKIIKGE